MGVLKPYLKGGRGTQNLLVDRGVLKPYLRGGRGGGGGGGGDFLKPNLKVEGGPKTT